MKKAAFALIISFIVMMSGCGNLGNGEQRPPSANYRTGSQGIVMNFLPNFPRAKLYEDEPTFDVIIEVKNKGAHDIGFGGDSIYLSGFDPSIITGISTTGEQIPEIEGASQYNPEGGYDNIDFSGRIVPFSVKGIDTYSATILATACYSYRTIGSENICIDPEPFSTSSEKKVCTPGIVSYGTQGAPIAVSAVDVEPTPKMARFKITIRNVGGGTVFRSGADYLARCSPYHTEGLAFNHIDMVKLSKVEVAGKIITSTCKPLDSEGNIRLVNGQATVFCELANPGSGPAYSTPMTVELDYGYRTTISTRTNILKAP